MNRGGARFRTLVLTRNRRVVLSVSRDGATLRVNRLFATAPETVLDALARVFASDRRDRARARAVVRGFLSEVRHAEPPRPRRRRVAREDLPFIARLRVEFDRVNRDFFDGALPAVPVYLSGRMRRRNGHFSIHPLEIVISRRLCTHGVAGEAERTLRHEMIHLWQHVEGRRPGHGGDFRAWARRLDVHPRATREVCWNKG